MYPLRPPLAGPKALVAVVAGEGGVDCGADAADAMSPSPGCSTVDLSSLGEGGSSGAAGA